ncbi:MAG: helix-turn-helix domain-containing protein [Bacilli bacterium]
MKYIYLKSELENLSQGERIAFARQVRKMTQDELAEKLGYTGESKRRGVTRYERGDRVPKPERLQEIADILNVNVKCLKEFDFRNNEDMIYMLLWMEEMYPRMNIDLDIPKMNHLKNC